MAEETSINVGGTWKAIDDCDVNVGGSWKQVNTISVNVGGTWKTVWQNFVVTLSGTLVAPNSYSQTATDPANAEAGIRLLRDGSLQRVVGGTWSDWFTTEWGDPESATVGDGYWVRATLESGDSPTQTSAGFGTWLQLNATREWSHLQNTVGTDGPTVIKLEISSDSSGTPLLDTGYYEFTATVDSGG